MSDQTGATKEQVDAAVRAGYRANALHTNAQTWDQRSPADQRKYLRVVEGALAEILPPTHRIVANDADHLSPATAEAVRRLVKRYRMILPNAGTLYEEGKSDLARIDALLGATP